MLKSANIAQLCYKAQILHNYCNKAKILHNIRTIYAKYCTIIVKKRIYCTTYAQYMHNICTIYAKYMQNIAQLL